MDCCMSNYIGSGWRLSVRSRVHPLTLRRQPGYDHSYFFISTFIEAHLRYNEPHLAA